MLKPLELQIRFADIDMLGHVNNAVYSSYFEMTRVHYLGEVLGKDWDYNKNGFLLARIEIDYIKPVYLHDKPVIEMRSKNIGNKSFSFTYSLMVEGEVRTKAVSVMVSYDSVEHKTIPIPQKMREAFEELEAE